MPEPMPLKSLPRSCRCDWAALLAGAVVLALLAGIGGVVAVHRRRARAAAGGAGRARLARRRAIDARRWHCAKAGAGGAVGGGGGACRRGVAWPLSSLLQTRFADGGARPERRRRRGAARAVAGVAAVAGHGARRRRRCASIGSALGELEFSAWRGLGVAASCWHWPRLVLVLAWPGLLDRRRALARRGAVRGESRRCCTGCCSRPIRPIRCRDSTRRSRRRSSRRRRRSSTAKRSSRRCTPPPAPVASNARWS